MFATHRALSIVSLNQCLLDEIIEGTNKETNRGQIRKKGSSRDPYIFICIKVLLLGSVTAVDVNAKDTGPRTCEPKAWALRCLL